MSKRNKNWRTAAEVIAEQSANPDHLRLLAEKEERRRKRNEKGSDLERPILERMKAIGYEANSLDDAVRQYCPLPDSLAALILNSLAATSSLSLLETLIRALATARNPFDGRPLINCYKTSTDWNLRWVIANTIACVRPHSIDEWVKDAFNDPELGKWLRELGMRQAGE